MNSQETFGSPLITGRRLTLWAWLFALLLAGLSLPWMVWIQHRSVWAVLLGPAPVRDLLLGALTGVLTALIAWQAFLRIPSLRAVLFHLRNVLNLDTLHLDNIVLIALSAGVGEEMLFRGVLQPHLGLWWTSLLFGLAHPLSLAYILYAALAGLILGGLVEATGALLPAIVCHTVVDAILLYKLKTVDGGR